MKTKCIFLICLFLSAYAKVWAQDEDVHFIRKIHDEILTNGKCYDWLQTICKKAPGRLSGSAAYDTAVVVASRLLKTIPGVQIKLQPVLVNVWDRGNKETVNIYNSSNEKIELHALSLGNSIGTGKKGITAEIIEVHSLDEVSNLGESKIKGKIVFYNRPMDVTQLNTFRAYGGAADQRVTGPSTAAEYGAVAVMVRSLGFEINHTPHTGSLQYKDHVRPIPAVAISTKDADLLSSLLKKEIVKGYIENYCGIIGTKETYNVIGEIQGTVFPEKIILAGGHLDSWDVGEGAHDDGAGCVHSMEVLRTLQALDYKPRHTIRCVLFANEENGLSGGLTYAEQSKMNAGEIHIAAVESDAGGFVPKRFSFDADTSVLKNYFKKVNEVLPIFETYDIQFELGGSGADIGPLKSQKGLLAGLKTDSSKYFDYHHTSEDNIEAVHPRELKMGAAAITSLVYSLDKYFN